MTTLLHRLGLSPQLSWTDVYSITDPDLIAFIPRPSLALVLVFPTNETYHKFRQEEDAGKAEYSGFGPAEEVIWFKQTIHNACGLYGLLHAVGNGAARAQITPNSELDDIFSRAVNLDPRKRSDVLEESTALEQAHHEAASRGDSTVPNIQDEVELHYVCFVKSTQGHLWEMDGARKGPLCRGELGPDDDVLSEAALDLGPRPFLKREQAAGSGADLRFGIVSLGKSFD